MPDNRHTHFLLVRNNGGRIEAESRQPSLGILIELAFGNIRKEFPVWSS
jgi:hypothetical protein